MEYPKATAANALRLLFRAENDGSVAYDPTEDVKQLSSWYFDLGNYGSDSTYSFKPGTLSEVRFVYFLNTFHVGDKIPACRRPLTMTSYSTKTSKKSDSFIVDDSSGEDDDESYCDSDSANDDNTANSADPPPDTQGSKAKGKAKAIPSKSGMFYFLIISPNSDSVLSV
jgi:hypothetical protein